ncbi:hypothetical protein [Algicella marina]|uniref:Uncharacterized protein n=1 Tax=Algicella marina TaxID=2683284 RepID=A0A6P1T534_9RHOB|nr:hypothetical protein [Algicella marina]QHQ36830.1 hypothetical protein GO499_17400 [Algicella marina]
MFRLFAAVVLLPAPLCAACPVAGDLDGGIYVTDNDGAFTRFTREGDLIVEQTEFFETGEAYRYTVARGLFIRSYADVVDDAPVEDTQEAYGYSRDPGTAEIGENALWQTRLIVTFADGSDPVTENYTFSSGTARDVAIGACNYRAIPVAHTTLRRDEGSFIFVQNYLTDLGIAVATGYYDIPGGFSFTPYRSIEISTERPNGP